MLPKPFLYGVAAGGILLGAYFAILSAVSGWSFAQDQFSAFWYYTVSLSVGFGVQIGLYAYARERMREMHGGVLGVTGTTSTAAMVSCCTHYLAKLLPVLGIAGVVTFVAQYQVELFWVGLLFNIAGIAYLAHKTWSI